MQQPCKLPAISPDGADGSVAEAADQIDAACQMIATGRLAASQLAVHAKSFSLSEAEFRLLWLLRTTGNQLPVDHSPRLLDQKAMSKRLGLSPAQVSTVVERLRKESLVSGRASPADRRRQVWQLTASGKILLENSIAQYASTNGNRYASPAANQEDAA